MSNEYGSGPGCRLINTALARGSPVPARLRRTDRRRRRVPGAAAAAAPEQDVPAAGAPPGPAPGSWRPAGTKLPHFVGLMPPRVVT